MKKWPRLPTPELLDIIQPSLSPCSEIKGACSGSVRYDPAVGHIPRGWIGGFGALDEIRLLLVTAEPGNPGDGESYPSNDPGGALRSYHDFALAALTSSSFHRGGKSAPFHSSLRIILDAFWPETSLDDQLTQTFIVPAVLCSASVSRGKVPMTVERTCGERYLLDMITAVPNAIVVALGGKAKARLRRLGRPAEIFAQHPSAFVHTNPEQSWREAAIQFRTIMQFR